MAKEPSETELLNEASFVFKGTVKELKASTVPQLAATDQMAIVQVDQIIHASEALSYYGGKPITVLLSGGRRIAVGDELMFYATEWLFGKDVAVRSLAERPAAQMRQTLASAGSDPVRTRALRKLEARVDQADLVITGTVTSVNLPAGRTSAPRSLKVSEHDPQWAEAVVEVDDMHKGSGTPRTIIVRFPASRDIAWNHAPKFLPGDHGHFVLKKAEPSGTSERSLRALAEAGSPGQADVYTALDPGDFQRSSQPEGLKRILNLPE